MIDKDLAKEFLNQIGVVGFVRETLAIEMAIDNNQKFIDDRKRDVEIETQKLNDLFFKVTGYKVEDLKKDA